MSAHVHAELMLQYAQDALKTDKPWLLWEIGDGADGWDDLDDHPWWIKDSEYRRKPEMITVGGGISFPTPVKHKPKEGEKFWIPDFYTLGTHTHYWEDDEFDNCLLNNGMIHLTEDAAQQHLDALIKINRGEF
ncbi:MULTISPECIES: hypothetical protein [unclassified Photorhabdus]|uniref:hypothetical protein n=1 Tax=unclassified Photorhabdus TaxID=2620880 RepID=UPI000DCB80CA|nr:MULTISPECIES: hypothetical protein [unclassified Photorhabdus]RAW91978.1 hypothetical protein CKY05_23610 [Photorhabdus sp. S10-54]RAW92151.1 hypothetical protein CKY03_23555 [Photorhabdus sp. S9-53]RAW95563.1 hypothetical protein CKY04_23645 [Photorhabdus sp. S8-52]